MINNQPNKDQQSVDQVNNLLTAESKPVKIGWWRKVLHFGRLFGDVGHYVFDEGQHSEKIKRDILKIETEREAERRRLDVERDRLEKLAKKQHLETQEVVKKNFQNWMDKEPSGLSASSKQIETNKLDTQKENLSALIDKTVADKKTTNVNESAVKTIKAPKKPNVFITWLKSLFSSKTKSASKAMDFNKLTEAPQNDVKPASVTEAVSNPAVKLADPIKKSSNSQPDSFPAFGHSNVKVTPTAGLTESNKNTVSGKEKAPEPVVKNNPVVNKQLTTADSSSDKKKSSFFEHKSRLAKHFAEEYAREAKLFAKNEVENRYWHSMSLVRANLVKDQRSLFFNWRHKLLTLLFFATCAVLVSLLVFGGLLIWENNKKEANKYIFDNLESINKQIDAEHNFTREIDGFNSRLMYVNYLLDNHIYWTRFFTMLENRTVANVYYRELSADLSGQYKIPAVSKNFADITNQINVMMANENEKYKGLIFNGWVNKADSLNAVIVDDKTKAGIIAAGSAQGPESTTPGTEQATLTNDSEQATSEISANSTDPNAPKPGQVSFTLDLQINPQSVFIKQ